MKSLRILYKSALSGLAVPNYSMYQPGCGNAPDPTCQDCPVKELGGVRGAWVQKAGLVWTDITNPAEWQANICNKSVYVFPFTNGSVTQDPNLSDGYGNLPQTVDGYTYNVEIHEPQYKNNVPFWNFIKKGVSYQFGYKTQTMLHLSSVSAMFTPMAPVGKDVKSKIDMDIKVSFVQQDLIVPIGAGNAEAIFDTCNDC